MQEVLAQLKTELYLAARKAGEKKQLTSILCVCIGYLCMQAQWPNFIEEIIEYFGESLESVAVAMKVLKEIIEQVNEEDIVISETRRRAYRCKLVDYNPKILKFLDKWAENVNSGKLEGTALLARWKLTKGV